MPIRRLLAVVMLVVVVASACRSEDNTIPPIELQDRIIATASTTDDPSQVVVTWFPAPCEAFEEVQVELDDRFARLRVRVSVDIETCPQDGVSEAVVDLGEPLGDRRVFDESFGERGDTVALNTEPSNPGS